MVLPGRIELPTSPLPRECSTTELRQRTDAKRADTCHRRRRGATLLLDDWTNSRENPAMSGEKITSGSRKERLAKALKANIAKRKQQARTRAETEDAPETPESEDGCPN